MWIEIPVLVFMQYRPIRSRLARALWIEILSVGSLLIGVIVEARESLVD